MSQTLSVDVGADEVFVVDEGVVVAVAAASILLAESGDDVSLTAVLCVFGHDFKPQGAVVASKVEAA